MIYLCNCTNIVLNGVFRYIQRQSFKFNFPALVILILSFCLDFPVSLVSGVVDMGAGEKKI